MRREHDFSHISVIDVSGLVAELMGVLRQTMGEATAVEATLAPNLPLAYIDRTQLEAAILELAVNARDAMPRGGRIVIETADATLADSFRRAEGGAFAPGPGIARKRQFQFGGQRVGIVDSDLGSGGGHVLHHAWARRKAALQRDPSGLLQRFARLALFGAQGHVRSSPGHQPYFMGL